ncbi:MAG: type II CAAX endopeptidase family protein [Pyrinomonadaceae bacterium]|nr:type II CAAX endopeptidase family protein [Pyrinomonadaceae bacterium]
MNIARILFDSSGRLRSGWRFAIFVTLFVLFSGAAGAALFGLGRILGVALDTGSPGMFLSSSAVSLAVALGIGWFCGKYLEKLPFRALGAWFTKGWARHLGAGVIVGALTVSAAALVCLIAGGVSFAYNGTAGLNSILTSLAIAGAVLFAAAAFEEALFRGYILQTFSRSGLAWFAIILTSIFFAAMHLDNPNSNWISSLNTGIAGIWFGVAYMKTRDLWFVTGLHMMWNWTLGAVFGIEISGITSLVESPVLREIDHGPAWLTGGTYGLEGGIAATFALIASTIAIRFLPIFKPDPELVQMTSPATAHVSSPGQVRS